LGNEGFDFLILDILIPNEDGWQVLKDVKSNLKTKDIPIIILTAKNGDSDMIKGYAMGASYYITKPFTKAQLLYGLKLIFEENYESLPLGRQG
jgi:two-component system alkaline phosphatase synthesis response regulator PhoP